MVENTRVVLILLLTPGSLAALSLSLIWEFSSTNTGSACVHTCMGLAQQLEGKCSVDTVPLFCAGIARKVEIAKGIAPQFPPHKHAPRYQDRKNTGEVMTKEKALHKRN